MKYILTVALCLFLFSGDSFASERVLLDKSPSATAQEDPTTVAGGEENQASPFTRNFDESDPNRGALGYLLVGYLNPNLDSLNRQLSDHGYSKLPSNIFAMGVGGNLLFDPWIVGMELNGIIQQKMTGDSYTTTLNGGYLMVNGGYLIYTRRTLKVYPMAGIGVGTLTLGINGNSQPSFNQVMSNPKQDTTIFNSSMVLNVALAADGLFYLGGGNGERVLSFGFRAGFLYSLEPSDWRNAAGIVSGGPSAGFTGPYLQIALGGGFLF